MASSEIKTQNFQLLQESVKGNFPAVVSLLNKGANEIEKALKACLRLHSKLDMNIIRLLMEKGAYKDSSKSNPKVPNWLCETRIQIEIEILNSQLFGLLTQDQVKAAKYINAYMDENFELIDKFNQQIEMTYLEKQQ